MTSLGKTGRRATIGAARGAAIAAALLLHAAAAPAGTPAPITLASQSLRVTVAPPDAAGGFYRGTRFDWSGMITQVTYAGQTFYGPWFDASAADVRDYVDDGRTLTAGLVNAAAGPADEFVPPQGEAPPGFAEAAAGGTFLKIGVGRLVRPDGAAYDRFRPYAITGGTAWKVTRRGSSISFVQRIAPDASGYGYVYEKTVSAAPGGLLTIAHRLTNTGGKPLRTQVYNHNFTRFNEQDSAPPLRIETPWQLGPLPDRAKGLAETEGGTLRLLKPLGAGEVVSFVVPAVPADPAAARFTIRGAAASVSVSGDQPLSRVLIWTIRKAAAVEPYVLLDIAPGQSQAWSWTYRFTAD